MASSVYSQLQGVGATIDKMRNLAPRLQKKGLRRAAREAMNIIRDDVKARAKALDDPDTKEKIWRNVITQEATKQSRREGGVVMRVGIRGGAGSNQHSKDATGNPGGDTRHWRYIEFGTQFTPPAPFMRPAFSQNVNAVAEQFVASLGREIDDALRGN